MPHILGQSHQFFHSYCLNPDVHFEDQAEGEKVILVLRAHPFTQLFWVLNAIFFVILLFVFDFIFPTFLNSNQIIFINIFVLFGIASYVWMNFLTWFFNVGIVTNIRVIDIDFENVIYTEISEARLNKVQDITSKSGGFFEAFFNYGDLYIQTAGTASNIEFLNIPNSSDVVRIIDDLTGK